ncbi:FAD-dependent monooxygenase [Streptosporangium minutum]|uniref:FAD-binding monooxygenase n=1 Tax=Streptosporangium minutum TaxID=569862 RepID=A0A243REE2_9ACTN|nr:FAD-dependent monooxygenase [Streptosporangium minutum]OUC93092.1 FAD-binding monooxygenase [Streptosporangium minutum]
MNNHIDVLVVGAGPAGLTLACDLQRRGVNHRIVNAAEHGFAGSRAKGVQPRTLEVFDDLGILPELQSRGTFYPLLGLHLGPLTLPWVMYRRHKATEHVPHPNTMLVPQFETDACIRRRLEELGGTVEYGTRLPSYQQDADSLVVTVEGPGGTEQIRTRFLVGADGGASTVRLTAGIDFVGTTDETDRMIVADVTLSGLSRKRWHVWPRNNGRFMALCPLPGSEKFQLMLKLRPDEKADLSQAAVDRLVQEFVGLANLHVREIHWASVWRPNIRLAERYRSGNVFLVGDAAHVHPPTGAQGLNTGVQDAYNLGWKLAQVLAGAPDALLDSYEAERQPVAARVLGLSSELYAGMSDRPLTAVKRGDEERQLTLSYAAPATERQEGAVGAGDRAPDARYTDALGHSGRLFDLFRGPHFTLIAIGDAAIDALEHLNWPDTGAPLTTVAIPSGAAPGLTRSYGIQGPTHVLVRPDGYVAYVAHGDWNAVLDTHAQLMLPKLAT